MVLSRSGFPSSSDEITRSQKGDEFGLVNAKGRIYDPRLGRFLSTDPIISNLFSGQTLNAYSYVTNNPLSFVDPSGFEPEKPPILPIREEVWTDANGEIHVDLFYPPREARPSASIAPPSEAVYFGAAAPSTDVDTTGSWSAPDPSLPILELPHATGPGSDDPFGIKPLALAVGYDRPLSLLEQFLVGEQSGGRSTFMLPYEPGFFRDLGIAIETDRHVVTLRPQITEFLPPSPLEAALGRMAAAAIPMVAAALIPGPVDDFALAAGTAGGSAARGAAGGVRAGEAGAYGALRARSMPGDVLTPHHMPQAAMEFTTRAEGGSLVLPHSEHVFTRTFGGRGGATLRAEQGMGFRDVLARDIRDIRQLFGPKYDQGLRDLLKYYRQNYPELMAR